MDLSESNIYQLEPFEKYGFGKPFSTVATLKFQSAEFGNVVQPEFVEDRHN